MLVKKIDVDFTYNDERGNICQILSFPNSQINYLFTKKNAKRGSHYHKNNYEYFYVISGKVEISAFNVNNTSECEQHIFQKNDFFMVEKYVQHDFKFLEDTQMIVVYDQGVETSDNIKDIYTV